MSETIQAALGIVLETAKIFVLTLLFLAGGWGPWLMVGSPAPFDVRLFLSLAYIGLSIGVIAIYFSDLPTDS